MSLKAEFSYKTDPGKVRDNNEDSLIVCDQLGLAAVADGMGGHNSGELASSIAVKVLKERLASINENNIKPPDYDDKLTLETNRLVFAVKLANDIIFEASKNIPENQGMGTTLSAMILNKKTVSIAHIGDSRIYLFREGRLKQLTADHSLVMEQVKKGIITPQQAEKSSLQNILTRALGTRQKVKIDAFQAEAEEGDRYLLCTDGLSKTLGDGEISGILSENPDRQSACEALVSKANDAGGPDNVTVVIMETAALNWKKSLKSLFNS